MTKDLWTVAEAKAKFSEMIKQAGKRAANNNAERAKDGGSGVRRGMAAENEEKGRHSRVPGGIAAEEFRIEGQETKGQTERR